MLSTMRMPVMRLPLPVYQPYLKDLDHRKDDHHRYKKSFILSCNIRQQYNFIFYF